MNKMKYKSYPEYKDSGIEWIGKIPRHWEASLLKRFCQRINDGSHFSPEIQYEGYPYITVKDLMEDSIDFNNCKRISLDDFLRLQKNGSQPQIGDVLLSKDGTIGKCIVVNGYSDFVVLSSLGIVRPRTSELLPQYLRYYIVSGINIQQMESCIHGAALTRLTIDLLGKLVVTIPTIQDQENIVSFLDKEIYRINNLLGKNNELIELLKEKRIVLISHAVTKGLDPNVKMKDSGVEWIGEIPQHWKVTKARDEFRLLDYRRVPLSAEVRGAMQEKKYDYYGASGVIDKVDDYIFDEPLILLGEDGANLYARSTPLAFLAKGKYWVNNHAHILKPKTGDINYFTYLLESIDYTPYITGSAQPKLTGLNLKGVSLVAPPKVEQVIIAEYLSKETSKIDKFIEKIQKQIELLNEYKTSLISHAVTGKIDVRGEVI